MDASRILKNRCGAAFVWLVASLFALLAIAALVIDLGYMYVCKSQLQNATDAGALAGAGNYSTQLTQQLQNPSYTPDYNLSRTAAQNFAQMNNAAGSQVLIGNNGNTLDNNNDIVVGFWNFTTHVASSNDIIPSTTKINAVKVRARRTTDSKGVNGNLGPIETFFGKVLGILNSDVKAASIAALPIRSTGNIAVCFKVCSSAGGEKILKVDPNIDNAFAWTSLTVPQSSASTVAGFVCKSPPNEDTCSIGKIYSTMGTQASTIRDFQTQMYDPYVDAGNKICADDKTCDISSSTQVKWWWLTIPVTKICPPGAQGNNVEPKEIGMYATIRIKAICGSGGSMAAGCWGQYNPPPNACDTYGNNVVVIDQIKCTACGSPNAVPGLKAILVK